MVHDKELFSNPKRKPPFEVEPDFVKEIRGNHECVFCHKMIPDGSTATSMPGKDYEQEDGGVNEFYVARNYAHYPDCKNPTVAEPKPEPKEGQINLFEK